MVDIARVTRITVKNATVTVKRGMSGSIMVKPNTPDNRADALTKAYLIRDCQTDYFGDEVILDFLVGDLYTNNN